MAPQVLKGGEGGFLPFPGTVSRIETGLETHYSTLVGLGRRRIDSLSPLVGIQVGDPSLSLTPNNKLKVFLLLLNPELELVVFLR